MMMFGLVWTAVFSTLRSLDLVVGESSVPLLPTVFALRNILVHVCTVNNSYV